MPEHVVPVDRELSEELEEYFALTTATELPSGVRHLDSWSLSEAHRRRWAWRTGGGTLAAVVVVAAVLVLTLHRGGSAGQTPLADSAASKGVASSVARSGNGSSASGLLGIAPGSAGFSQQALPADGAGDTTTQGKSPDAPLSLPAGAAAGSVVLGLALGDFRTGLGPSPWTALGWMALLALTSQVIGWLLITVAMPRLAAGMIGALLLIQPAGSVALSYVILGEHPSALQLLGVVLVLTGVVVAVSGPAPAYSRPSTRIIRHASGASTGEPVSKSP